CSDIFYHPEGRARFAVARAQGALAVDMETSALYRISEHFGARALSMCVVVDNIETGEQTDYSERQALFTDMSRLALAVAAES
ncbi:purine-nucleoside phosphorylase, partial [Mesorhizobium sp. M7A.F.Ca.US.006.01.2.1]